MKQLGWGTTLVTCAVLGLLTLVLCSCGGWLETTKRSLIGAKAGTDATHRVSVYVFHSRCMAVAEQCKVKASLCAPLKACQAKRTAFDRVVKVVLRSLDAARALVELAARATKADNLKDAVLAAAVKALTEFDTMMRLAKSLGVTGG